MLNETPTEREIKLHQFLQSHTDAKCATCGCHFDPEFGWKLVEGNDAILGDHVGVRQLYHQNPGECVKHLNKRIIDSGVEEQKLRTKLVEANEKNMELQEKYITVLDKLTELKEK